MVLPSEFAKVVNALYGGTAADAGLPSR